MRKTLTVILAAAVCTAMFAGCGSKSDETSAKSASAASSASGTESSAASQENSESTSVSSESTEASSVSSESTEESSVEVLDGEITEEATMEYVDGDWTFDECIKLPDYKGYELTKEVAEVTDEAISDYYKANMEAEEVTDKDATVEEGDELDTTYQLKVGDGDYTEAQDYTFTVGAGTNIDGFEEGMIGHKVGDDVYLDLSFPDDYWDETYAGQEANFHVVIEAIKRQGEPTDAWVKEFTDGEYTTVDDYTENYVKKYLAENAETTALSTLRSNAWNTFYDGIEFYKLPEEYVEEGFAVIENQLMLMAQNYGYSSIEEYIEASGSTTDEYEEYVASTSESYAKSLLAVNALWDAEKMSEDDELFKNAVKEIADAQGVSEEELYESYSEDQITNYAKSIAVNDMIISYADVTETTLVEGE